jgi:hypothetical protein
MHFASSSCWSRSESRTREKGSNVQELTCADEGYDRVTGLALQSAIPVDVRPVA